MTTKEVLQQCTVEGNIVKLPAVQLERKEYKEVKKQLELIGGKWKGGKTQGFVFEEDPTELLEQISNGEKRNLKSEDFDEPIAAESKEVATVPKIEKRWLRYDFEPDEVHQLSVEMANKVQELQQVEQEKKSVTSSYTSRANSLKSHITDLSNKVASGYESREIDCLVKYHEPKRGWKTLIRKDNSKKIEERMLPSEWTLFTQPLENEELETV